MTKNEKRKKKESTVWKNKSRIREKKFQWKRHSRGQTDTWVLITVEMHGKMSKKESKGK
jgi:hypothetical protein